MKKTAKGKVGRAGVPLAVERRLNNGLTHSLKEERERERERKKEGVEKKHVWHSNQIPGRRRATMSTCRS